MWNIVKVTIDSMVIEGAAAVALLVVAVALSILMAALTWQAGGRQFFEAFGVVAFVAFMTLLLLLLFALVAAYVMR